MTWSIKRADCVAIEVMFSLHVKKPSDPIRSRYIDVELLVFRLKLKSPIRIESFLRSVKNSSCLSRKVLKCCCSLLGARYIHATSKVLPLHLTSIAIVLS
jgi:hypothetical protein